VTPGTKEWGEMVLAVQKSLAMYELLMSHAAGVTDFTEDQLGAVVSGLAREAREVLDRLDPLPPLQPHAVAIGALLEAGAGHVRDA
jgi:hypothetical protein